MASWQKDALCKSDEHKQTFRQVFGDSNDNTVTLQAKKVCLSCPVAHECYMFAWRNNEIYGVWGGVNFNKTQAKSHNKRLVKIMKQKLLFDQQYTKETTQ